MKRLTAWIATFLLSIIGVAFLLILIGFRFNVTDSIPFGLYRITNLKKLKNSYVIFCPENRPVFQLAKNRGYIDSGLCPGVYGYLMKKVVATGGDEVSITNDGVLVNQSLIPFSKPLPLDGIKRPMPQEHFFAYQLKEKEILTMTSQSKWSFDGRYYGPIHVGQVKGVITPIWVKSKHGDIT